MRNFLLGCVVGLVLGAVGYGWAQTSHTPSPYAPGSFMSETYLYNQMLNNSTDAYLNDLKARERSLSTPCPY